MSKVTVVGAGLAGLVAALNCAKAGHRVRVLERCEGVGDDAHARPAVDVTPMNPEALGRFIGVELKEPHIQPAEEFIGYIYGKRYSIPGDWLYLNAVERGVGETSFDQYLYREAVAAGVEFEFGTSLDTQEDFARLPAGSIIATGLVAEPFRALRRECLDVYGFIAKGTIGGPPRVMGFLDHYTKYYCYCANLNGVAFGLGFDARPVPSSLRDEWRRQLEEWEGWRFEEWLPHEGVVATRKINSPGLFTGNKILAGTVSGMQDPFALFGVHSSLCSGKIAAMAVDDKERAWRLFKDFTSAYRISWSLKRLFDMLPDSARGLGLGGIIGLFGSHREALQPFVDRILRTIPGFGNLR